MICGNGHARPRAPLAAVGGKARANNRGLAKEIPDWGPKNPVSFTFRKSYQNIRT